MRVGLASNSLTCKSTDASRTCLHPRPCSFGGASQSSTAADAHSTQPLAPGVLCHAPLALVANARSRCTSSF